MLPYRRVFVTNIYIYFFLWPEGWVCIIRPSVTLASSVTPASISFFLSSWPGKREARRAGPLGRWMLLAQGKVTFAVALSASVTKRIPFYLDTDSHFSREMSRKRKKKIETDPLWDWWCISFKRVSFSDTQKTVKHGGLQYLAEIVIAPEPFQSLLL